MWKRLNYTDLTEILAQDEINKLDVYSLSADISSICQKQLDSVADMFRGSWSAKGYALDVREHYVAPEYRIPVLNYARWQIWTRFPNSKDIGLVSRNYQYSISHIEPLTLNVFCGIISLC